MEKEKEALFYEINDLMNQDEKLREDQQRLKWEILQSEKKLGIAPVMERLKETFFKGIERIVSFFLALLPLGIKALSWLFGVIFFLSICLIVFKAIARVLGANV